MTRFVGLDVSQKLTSICVVDETGRRRLLSGSGVVDLSSRSMGHLV